MGYYNLNYRVKPTSFRDVCDAVKSYASTEVIEILDRLNVLHFFELPPFLPNNGLIYELFSSWNSEVQSFKIKEKLIKFNVEDVSVIIGMPNRGELLHWEGEPLSKETSTSLKHKMRAIKPICDTYEYVRTFLQFLISNLFFISRNLKIASALIMCGDNSDIFHRFNWPEGIFRYLKKQLDGFKSRDKKGGYVSGFITVLLIWFLEHCDIKIPEFPYRRPLILRWSSTITWSSAHISFALSTLENDKIYDSILDINQSENHMMHELPHILPHVTSSLCTPDAPDVKPFPSTELEDIRKSLEVIRSQCEIISTVQAMQLDFELLQQRVGGLETRVRNIEEMIVGLRSLSCTFPSDKRPHSPPLLGGVDITKTPITMTKSGNIVCEVKRRHNKKRKSILSLYNTGLPTRKAN